jgi:hypothetical protein
MPVKYIPFSQEHAYPIGKKHPLVESQNRRRKSSPLEIFLKEMQDMQPVCPLYPLSINTIAESEPETVYPTIAN